MSWLSLIIVYVLCESSGIYIDNYISDYYFKGKLAVAQKYFYILPYFLTALVLLAIGNSFFPPSLAKLSRSPN